MRHEDIVRHVDHEIVCVEYVSIDGTHANAAIECLTCMEVIIDADQP